MKITKSSGVTKTENLLADLCEATFLKLWSYPNPYKDDGKELCDLIAIFDNHIFIFFDREQSAFQKKEKDITLNWTRWKKEVVDKQIKTAIGAESYLLGKGKIFLDAKQQVPLPLLLPDHNLYIHKIIVAHGAKDACKDFSNENISGSLAISYGEVLLDDSVPFSVELDKKDTIHLFDSENIDLILKELDTVYDFKSYIVAKEKAIKELPFLIYSGEEDLLAYYFQDFDKANECHYISPSNKSINGMQISQGMWQSFSQSSAYVNRKKANKPSYLWDSIIQQTAEYAFNGTLVGDMRVFSCEKSALFEMAKEPRVARRGLSDCIQESIENFSKSSFREMVFLPSYYPETGYIFLQLSKDDIAYDDYRVIRQRMLDTACGVAKNKFPHLKKMIGIAVEPLKFNQRISTDFALLLCEEWSSEKTRYYEEKNKDFEFFETTSLRISEIKIQDFPQPTS